MADRNPDLGGGGAKPGGGPRTAARPTAGAGGVVYDTSTSGPNTGTNAGLDTVENQTNITTPADTALTASQTPSPPAGDGLTAAEEGQFQSAKQLISSFLATVPGLSTLDPSNQLGQWMIGQASTLAGQNMDSGTIQTTIQTTMNNPGASGDQQAQQVFDQLFPGYNQRIQNGYQNGGGIAAYLQYATQIQAFANTAKLSDGVVTASEIGNLWAGDVSAGEVSDRITSAYTAAVNTPQPVQDYLQSAYGIGPGGIASYYLNPTNSLASLSSVNTGIAGVESGFGAMSKAQSDSLSAFLATPSSTGMNLVSSQQAQQALTSGNLGGATGTSAAQLAQGGYEQNAPGQIGSERNLSEDQLIGAVEGNAADTAAATLAVGSRTAGSRGGGGFSQTAKGASGIGFAQ